MNNITSLQLIIGREDENEYIEIDLNEYNEKYKQLKSRINKAIEYIESKKKILNKQQIEETNLQVGTFMWGVDELLDILKGSDSNER